ncbi:MAG TPA: hypothetical protein VM008_16530 [Phycisphaerae bacterium]|nr:hypothetical protein [Phycisphaerae bacterium]
MPRVLSVTDDKGCRCPECCRKMVEEELGNSERRRVAAALKDGTMDS